MISILQAVVNFPGIIGAKKKFWITLKASHVFALDAKLNALNVLRLGSPGS